MSLYFAAVSNVKKTAERSPSRTAVVNHFQMPAVPFTHIGAARVGAEVWPGSGSFVVYTCHTLLFVDLGKLLDERLGFESIIDLRLVAFVDDVQPPADLRYSRMK